MFSHKRTDLKTPSWGLDMKSVYRGGNFVGDWRAGGGGGEGVLRARVDLAEGPFGLRYPVQPLAFGTHPRAPEGLERYVVQGGLDCFRPGDLYMSLPPPPSPRPHPQLG